MSELPEDIIKVSRIASSSIRFLDYEERQAIAPYIARAVQSERERCAKIAEEAVHHCIDGGAFDVEYREEIAASIRRTAT